MFDIKAFLLLACTFLTIEASDDPVALTTNVQQLTSQMTTVLARLQAAEIKLQQLQGRNEVLIRQSF